jgi:hypothetical protein
MAADFQMIDPFIVRRMGDRRKAIENASIPVSLNSFSDLNDWYDAEVGEPPMATDCPDPSRSNLCAFEFIRGFLKGVQNRGTTDEQR